MIEAFHSNWTAPFFEFNSHNEYYIEDFEILTTIISALKWREKNGAIRMITDEVGAEYYKNLGIDSIWDLGIDLSLNNIKDDIDRSLFWAAGKIYALKTQKEPCVMIDTDFIVWESIEEILKNQKICTIHKEKITNEVYPDKYFFEMKDGYIFDKDWDWSVLPSNTAFTYIADEKFKEYYTKCAIDFMENLIGGKDRIVNMVFAEQRLLSMCANKMDIPIKEIMSLEDLFGNKQKIFTHTWGYKDSMKRNYIKRKDFCIRCIKRIINDYPEYEGILANIKELQPYYNEIKYLKLNKS